MLEFLLAIPAFFAAMAFYFFWPIIALLILFSAACLDREPAWGWWTIWTLPMGLLLYFRFQPSMANVLLGTGVYILTGVVYSVWMWFKECKTLRFNINKAADKVVKWPGTVFISNCELRNGYNREVSADSFADLLKKCTPQFSEHRSLVSYWTILWALLLTKDLTVDLIKNIQDMLKGVYQSIANNQFQS